MNTRIHLVALGTMLVALSFPAAAQQSAKVHRIGYLSTANPSPPSAFRQGLRELNPVIFPPGRARLVTNPFPIGSGSCKKTRLRGGEKHHH
jgi:hypothetical protein